MFKQGFTRPAGFHACSLHTLGNSRGAARKHAHFPHLKSIQTFGKTTFPHLKSIQTFGKTRFIVSLASVANCLNWKIDELERVFMKHYAQTYACP